MDRKYDLLCCGTALVDSMITGFDPVPISAAGYRAESGTLRVGGEAVNASIAAAKLGLRCAILCSLGMDAAGDMVEGALRKRNVDPECIIRSELHATPVSTMFIHDDGTRKSVTNKAHRYNFHPEQYTDILKSAEAVTLGSLFRAPFDDPDIILSVCRTVKESGAFLFADTKLPNFRKVTLPEIRGALPYIDYITPNEDEAKYHTGKDDPEEAADVLLDMGVRCVIVKLGAKGALLKNREETIRIPALPVRAVDATGAGDNFLAGFAAMKLEGKSDAEALRFANACGAVCTTGLGADTALKNREQVVRLLNKGIM